MAGETILIVDDEKDILQVVNDVLASEHYHLINVTNGEEALAVIAREKIDLVLLDLNMPGIGGYEVCRRVQKISDNTVVPIVIISSNSQEVDKIAALGLGAIDYITKPFSPGELRARVRTQLKMKNMHEDLVKQKSMMSKLAIHDELTGLYNRRYLLARMEEELARAVRYHSPMGCLLLDIDNFKHINDTNGHPAGDKVLVSLSEILRNFARETDVVARFGGEEFIIILPETDLQGAVAFAERLLEQVRHNHFSYNGVELSITVSVGVSSNQSTEITKEKILKEADDYLYKAKKDGKNCVRSPLSHTPDSGGS